MGATTKISTNFNQQIIYEPAINHQPVQLFTKLSILQQLFMRVIKANIIIFYIASSIKNKVTDQWYFQTWFNQSW